VKAKGKTNFSNTAILEPKRRIQSLIIIFEKRFPVFLPV
jgi:hypothetical protein